MSWSSDIARYFKTTGSVEILRKYLKNSCSVEISVEYCEKNHVVALPTVVRQQLGEVGKFIIPVSSFLKM